MSSSLKTLVLRWPAATAVPSARTAGSFALCCPRAAAAFSTISPSSKTVSSTRSAPVARPSMCLARATTTTLRHQLPRTFSRGLASAAQTPKLNSDGTVALDWDSFFKLRVRRRYFQLFFSVLGGVGGGAAGAIVLSTGVAEPVLSQIPLDPFLTLGLMTFACAGMGWLIGPSIGSEIFYTINRRFKKQMRFKESEFLARVRKNRADPTNSSAANPVPDFYGEKIQSVKGYRRWLKDQRAFNKKKVANFV